MSILDHKRPSGDAVPARPPETYLQKSWRRGKWFVAASAVIVLMAGIAYMVLPDTSPSGTTSIFNDPSVKNPLGGPQGSPGANTPDSQSAKPGSAPRPTPGTLSLTNSLVYDPAAVQIDTAPSPDDHMAWVSYLNNIYIKAMNTKNVAYLGYYSEFNGPWYKILVRNWQQSGTGPTPPIVPDAQISLLKDSTDSFISQALSHTISFTGSDVTVKVLVTFKRFGNEWRVVSFGEFDQ